jgi:hypothetical protein
VVVVVVVVAQRDPNAPNAPALAKEDGRLCSASSFPRKDGPSGMRTGSTENGGSF